MKALPTFALALALCVSTAHALNQKSGSVAAEKSGPGGYSDGVTYSIQPLSMTGDQITYQVETSGFLNVTGGASYSGGWVIISPASGGGFDKGSDTGAFSGTFTITNGLNFNVSVRTYGHYAYSDISPTATTISPESEWNFTLTAGMDVTYSVTFAIPANNTEGVINYEFYQNGEVINSYSTLPRDPASSLTLNGLPTNDPVTMMRVQYEYTWVTTDGVTQLIQTGATVINNVSVGTPMVGGSTAPSAPAPSPTPIVQSPTAPTAPPASPTPAPTPAAPTPAAAPTTPTPSATPTYTPIGIPYATPAGTDGATKADMEDSTNKLVAGLNAGNTAAATNASAIVTAINANSLAQNQGSAAVVGAINAAATANHTGQNAIISAINTAATAAGTNSTAQIAAANKAQVSLDRISSGIGNIQSSTAAIANNTAQIDATLRDRFGTTAEAQAAATGAGTSAGTQGTAAKSGIESLYNSKTGGPGSGTGGMGYTTGEGVEPSLSIEMPASFGGKTFDFNPFTSTRLGVVTSWFKSALAWLVVVTIGIWVWNELDVKAYQSGAMQQAKGNPVIGGTGAQITALTAAAAITTVVVALSTALLGWSFGEITFPAILSAMGTNPTTSMPAGALWMLNQVMPVNTIIAALLARLAWKLYCVPLFAGAMAAVRFIVP